MRKFSRSFVQALSRAEEEAALLGSLNPASMILAVRAHLEGLHTGPSMEMTRRAQGIVRVLHRRICALDEAVRDLMVVCETPDEDVVRYRRNRK